MNLKVHGSVSKKSKGGEMTKCTVIKCKEEMQDNLFCSNCRDDWINFCIVNGIHERQIPEIKIMEALKLFQEKIKG